MAFAEGHVSDDFSEDVVDEIDDSCDEHVVAKGDGARLVMERADLSSS